MRGPGVILVLANALDGRDQGRDGPVVNEREGGDVVE